MYLADHEHAHRDSREVAIIKSAGYLLATKTMFETKVGQVTNELGELLKKKDHKQAWTKAGELNALLKKEEAKDLKPELVEQLHNELRGYYYINSEIEKANKRLYAKGSKLIELASL